MRSVLVVLAAKTCIFGLLLFASLLLLASPTQGLINGDGHEVTVVFVTEIVVVFIISIELGHSISSLLRGVYAYRKDKIIRREIAVYITAGSIIGATYFYYQNFGSAETKRLGTWTGMLMIMTIVQISDRIYARRVLRRVVDHTIYMNQKAGNFIDEDGAASLYEIQLRRKVFGRYGSSPYESPIKNVLHVEYHQLMCFAARLERLSRTQEKGLFALDEIRRELICHVRSFGLTEHETEKWRKIADAPMLIFPDID
ncbi:unnamed protein product [Bursaphelenchus okinawaensis]|uniref:Uncharacterized protein n=1 Tax=Bursaphelenchus okinawaensis TaxID=465554 RepID=A0A811KUC2_9BILA|nr:unnamed protein product [Bursaphelenchus okinawaensis]CAG9113367.1 unnamed protein product [Bursaphelenchus okinawaensis]